MYDSVRAAWRRWNAPFEGVVYWMYLDTHKPPLVTTGMGNMIDPVSLALELPWQLGAGGAPATKQDVVAEFNRIRSSTYLSRAGAKAAERITKLRLSDAALDVLIARRLDANEATLKQHPAFAGFDRWPADAQLGLLSMAWAMGPGFGEAWPHFSAALAELDFAKAAAGCAMEGSPTPAARNAATRQAFEHAATVVATGADPSCLVSALPAAA